MPRPSTLNTFWRMLWAEDIREFKGILELLKPIRYSHFEGDLVKRD
jgi:hypothetical protein